MYLKAYQDGRDARVELGNYFRVYNTERPHQALGYQTPAQVFNSIPVEATSRGIVEFLIPDPLRIAGPNLNKPLSCPDDGVTSLRQLNINGFSGELVAGMMSR